MEWQPTYETPAPSESSTPREDPLITLSRAVDKAIDETNAVISVDFELDRGQLDQQGRLLSYVAQMVRNDITWGVEQEAEKDGLQFKSNVVVVAGMINVHHELRFVVGINGNARQGEFAQTYAALVPKSLAGVPIDVVAYNQEIPVDLPEKREKKGVPLPDETNPWNWHGEQKVIKYIKSVYGAEARRSLRVLGIAHVKGPCTAETAKEGTNYCKAYLERKHMKARKSGDYALNVAAYWFSKTPHYKLCSREYLVNQGIDIQ